MAKLVEIAARVRIPDGATGGSVRIQYDHAYLTAARIAGGMEQGQCKPMDDTPGWGKILNLTGDGPLMVYAGEIGDPVTPYLTLSVRPTGPAGILRTTWTHRARPHVNVGENGWNLKDLGDTGEATIVTPQQAEHIADLIEDFQEAADESAAQRLAVAQAITTTEQRQGVNNAQQVENNTQQAENEASAAEIVQRFDGLRVRNYANTALYIDGNRVTFAIVDANDVPLVYWTPQDVAYFPGGVVGATTPEKPVDLAQLSSLLRGGDVDTLSTREPVRAPAVKILRPAGFVDGREVMPLVQDAAGKVGLMMRRDAVLDAPGGVSAAGVLTTRRPVGYLNGQQVSHVFAQDRNGRVALALSTRGELIAPAGIISPTMTDLGGLLPVSTGEILTIGDSMPEGAGSTEAGGGPIARRIATALGRQYRIEALGGNTSTEVAARIGALPVRITAALTVPADASRVPVALTTPYLRGAGDQTRPVTVNGVPMLLSHNNGDTDNGGQNSPHYLRRVSPGAAVNIAEDTLLIPSIPKAAFQSILISWQGRNNPYDITNILHDTRAALNKQAEHVLSPRYIVLPVFPSTTGSILDAPLGDLRDAMRREYGERFYDGHVAEMTTAEGRLKPEYAIEDGLHWNNAGHGVLSRHLINFISWKGW